MGCTNTKDADEESSGYKGNGGRRGSQANLKFVENIFNKTGVKKTLESGEELIKQGSESESAYYIKDGKVDLMLADEKGNQSKLATRGPGDVLGELSLLLGHDASVSAIADGPVTVIEVKSALLLGMLREDPVQAGRLFKVSRPARASAHPKPRIQVVASHGRRTVARGRSSIDAGSRQQPSSRPTPLPLPLALGR